MDSPRPDWVGYGGLGRSPAEIAVPWGVWVSPIQICFQLVRLPETSDFERQTLWDGLEEAGFDLGQLAVFWWVIVTMYLTLEVINATSRR